MNDSALVQAAMNPNISSGLDLAYFIALLCALCILGVFALFVIGRPWIEAKLKSGESVPAVDKIDRALRYLDRAENDAKTMRDTLTSLRSDYVHLEKRVESHEKRLDALENNYSSVRAETVGIRDEYRQGIARAHDRIDNLYEGREK